MVALLDTFVRYTHLIQKKPVNTPHHAINKPLQHNADNIALRNAIQSPKASLECRESATKAFAYSSKAVKGHDSFKQRQAQGVGKGHFSHAAQKVFERRPCKIAEGVVMSCKTACQGDLVLACFAVVI